VVVGVHDVLASRFEGLGRTLMGRGEAARGADRFDRIAR
jgi:hypothetical protein